MQRVAYELSRHLSKLTDVKLIKWGGSNKWLPLVLPYILLRSLWALSITRTSIKVIYLQDGLLAPLGLILKLFGKPIAITIHGRDIAYENRLYQFLIPRCLRQLDLIICVSNAIRDACLTRGVSAEKTIVIANGISDDFYTNGDKRSGRAKLAQVLDMDLGDKKILLSIGRFIENKGIHWFVAEVMPKLSEAGCVYVIAGDGILAPLIRRNIEEKNLENSIFMVGWANDDMLRLLYNTADIFIMPNVPGRMEGFGLVALEASSCGLPVVASNLEGIRDAIIDGKNGVLVEPGCANEFTTAIIKLLEDNKVRNKFGIQARQYTLDNYGWVKMAEKYLEEFEKSIESWRRI